MKLTKKIQVLLICIAILFCIITISETFAKYLTTATGTSEMTIARWRILVNDQDIRNNSDISQVITPVIDSNPNIASGVIAPTSTGYFDVIIDHSAADVSFNYEMTVTNNSASSVSDIIITGYSINGGAKINLEEGETISDDIPNTVTNKVINLRIFIKWNDDDETETMDNTSDTNATSSNVNAKIDVNLVFTQLPNLIS